jgi:predicted branched-subunit amino acid permease
MKMPDDNTLPSPDFAERRRWFQDGASKAFSIPGLILFTAHIGFAGLAREAGMTMGQAVFMVLVIWALPGMVVLLGAVMSGAGLVAAAFAVALSSVRLTPMVVALVPELRGTRTNRLTLYLLAHFIAVTSWVIALQTVREVPRDLRTSYYFGLGSSLMLGNMIVVWLFYLVAEDLPPVVAAGLFLLTPMYFLTSLWGAGRERAAHIAMVLGLVLGPVLHIFAPGLDLLGAGLIGGGLAYGAHLFERRGT